MVSAAGIALIAFPLYFVYSNVSGLLKNIVAAKKSGLPYTVVLWIFLNPLALPLLYKLPTTWTERWIDYLKPDFVWKDLHSPWEKNGETFLTVSPGLVQVWVTNAEAIHQITTRREAFPKPLAAYKILDIFGRNILSTEGREWKEHRKVTSPSFNEKNNVLVFSEACSQTQGMLNHWKKGTQKDKTINEAAQDIMRLTLHIITSIGFGMHLLWPGENPTDKMKVEGSYMSSVPPESHTMSFENSLETLLEQLMWVLVLPGWLLRRLPFAGAKKAYESFQNWSQYMNELFHKKIKEAKEGHHAEGMDIMGALVKSSYGPKAVKSSDTLSDSDILGNAFVMILAGHETTSNSIHFSLIELANNPRAQREVQKEIQFIFSDSSPETWDYESSFNQLLGGFVGAVLNEQLRLMAPIIAIPKHVAEPEGGVITIDGKTIILPHKAHINLVTTGLHRNKRYWPTSPSTVTSRPDDLDDFKPERWLVAEQSGPAEVDEDDDGFGGFTGQASHQKLFRPVRGSYLPFSDGPRSCLGRRLAQVKIMAVLAVIFQQYSIELAVDEWASDDEVARMSDEEKRAVYKKAQEKSRRTMRTATSLITLKLHEGFIPIRLVKKGDERFINIVDLD